MIDFKMNVESTNANGIIVIVEARTSEHKYHCTPLTWCFDIFNNTKLKSRFCFDKKFSSKGAVEQLLGKNYIL